MAGDGRRRRRDRGDRRRSTVDHAITAIALAFYSMPTFLLGQLLLFFLFFQLYLAGFEFFPPGSYVAFSDSPLQWARFLILPWLSIALVTAATYSRLTRSAMIDVLDEDYIRTARAKGLTERRITYRHALRSSLTPVVSQFGIDLGGLMGGAIVTEVVFALPGLGREAVQAVATQDLPIIMGIAILSAVLVVAANLAVDLGRRALDPRVGSSEEGRRCGSLLLYQTLGLGSFLRGFLLTVPDRLAGRGRCNQ